MKVAVVVLVIVACATATPYYPRRQFPVRIVGGDPAIPHEFPWQISMRYNGQHICGGSIYNQNTIITAAHCAEIGPPSVFTVALGKHNLNSNDPGEQIMQVRNLHIHTGYPGDSGFSNDIAILKTDQIRFSATIGPVPIAPDMHTATGDATVTGWGTTAEGGSVSQILRKVDVPIVTDAACRSAYGASLVDDSMICAGLPAGGKDSCQGDSGGPFLARDLGTGYYLAGIVSWGFGCARPGYPGVYSEVSHQHDFIRAHAN